MSKKDELGQGIRSLLGDIQLEEVPEKASFEAQPLINSSSNIPLSQIEINPFQPRKDFNEKALQELANSIKVHGVIQPVTVRKLNKNKYQLIAGERRLRASRMVDLETIPSYVRTANDQEMLEMGLIENIQRENLNSIEIALNYRRLMEECGLKQDELAMRVGKERSTVTNYLRLLKLPVEIQRGLKSKQLSMGHARSLINIEQEALQIKLFQRIVKDGISVRKIEQLVKNLAKNEQNKTATSAPIPKGFENLQKDLQHHLGTDVKLRRSTDGSGEIKISFRSDEELNRLMGLFLEKG